MNQSPLLFSLLFLLPAVVGAASPSAKTSSASAQGSAWGALVLNDDTSANEGIGASAGANWVVVPKAGPGALHLGPALSLSRQSEEWNDGPCDRELEEDILEVSADGCALGRPVRPQEAVLDGGLHLFGAITGHSSDDDWVALTLGLGFPF